MFREILVLLTISLDEVRTIVDGSVSDSDIVLFPLAWNFLGNEPFPRLVGFDNHFSSVFFVLGFAREREVVLGFAVRDLVNINITL